MTNQNMNGQPIARPVPRKISSNDILGASTKFLQDKAEEEERRRQADMARGSNTYVGMKKANETDKDPSRTIYDMAIIPSYCAKLNRYDYQRIINHSYDISFDTGRKADNGKSNVFEYYRVVGLEEFEKFEQEYGQKVLTDGDRALVERVSKLLRTLYSFYPKFDKVGKGKKVDLPDTFMAQYRNRIKIGYTYNLMLIPGILLRTVIGQSMNVLNTFTLFNFTKGKLIETFIENIVSLSNNPQTSLLLEEALNGPDGFNITKYISMIVDKSQEDKASNNQAAFDRVVGMSIMDYNPNMFIIPGQETQEPFHLTQDMLNQVPDLWDKEGLYRVATFDRESYEKLNTILTYGLKWVADSMPGSNLMEQFGGAQDLMPSPNIPPVDTAGNNPNPMGAGVGMGGGPYNAVHMSGGANFEDYGQQINAQPTQPFAGGQMPQNNVQNNMGVTNQQVKGVIEEDDTLPSF